jgi:hypothetical protein
VPEEILWGERTMEIGRGYVAFTGLGLDEPFMSSAAPIPTADDTEPTLKIARCSTTSSTGAARCDI